MNTKNNRLKNKSFEPEADDLHKLKIKKKPLKAKDDSKVNVKSKRFWQERYEDEGEDLEKYIR